MEPDQLNGDRATYAVVFQTYNSAGSYICRRSSKPILQRSSRLIANFMNLSILSQTCKLRWA